jgi:hypothetical protein
MEETDEEGSRRAETAENRILVAFRSDNNGFAKLGHGLGDDEFSSTNFHSRRWDECGRTEEDEEKLFGWTHLTQCRRKSISSDERPSFLRGFPSFRSLMGQVSIRLELLLHLRFCAL